MTSSKYLLNPIISLLARSQLFLKSIWNFYIGVKIGAAGSVRVHRYRMLKATGEPSGYLFNSNKFLWK